MRVQYQAPQARIGGRGGTRSAPLAIDVLHGLSQTPKSIPCKYLYDRVGSLLFQRIMELPEYYLSRCEHEILTSFRRRLAKIVQGRPLHLIELGAGDGRKTKLLIEHFTERDLPFRYLPVDISKEAMDGLTKELRLRFPSIAMRGLVCDYFEGLDRISLWSRDAGAVNLVLFLGSNIGNLSPAEAKSFMGNVRSFLNPGDYVLVGFDLKKEITALTRAYNDSEGVTAEFNLNLLRRLNRSLGGHFDPGLFAFFSTYNPLCGAVESFLLSRKRQTIAIDGLNRSFRFEPWEPLQTESSYKFLESEVTGLARATGFVVLENAFDSRGYFMDSLWQVRREV